MKCLWQGRILPGKFALVAALIATALIIVDILPAEDGRKETDRERIEELERELKEAQEQGNQQEVGEIRELIRKLKAGRDEDDGKEDDAGFGEEPKHINAKTLLESVRRDLKAHLRASGEPVRITSGTFTERSSGKTYKWRIGEDHILYWEGQPYIPHAINEHRLWNHRVNVDHHINYLMEDGIAEFPICYDMDNFPGGKYSEAVRKKNDERLRRVIERINDRGGAYIAAYSGSIVAARLGLRRREDRSIDFMLREETQRAFRMDMRRFGRVLNSPGLRAVEFMEEINALDGIHDSPQRLYQDLPRVLDIYGTMVKEEIGNVPVFIRPAPHARLLLPYLYALTADHIDGLNMQIHGGLSEEVEFYAKRLSLPRLLNACRKTKLYWAYSQATASGFTLHRSKELMRQTYQTLVRNGVTGFPFDQVSSFGPIEFGLPPDPPELRRKCVRWYGEIKKELADEVLQRAKQREFSTGKHAAPLAARDVALKAPSASRSDLREIARNHPDVRKLVQLGGRLLGPWFNPNYGLWWVDVGINGEWPCFLVIEDSKKGTVVFNGVEMISRARELGYPIPGDRELIKVLSSKPD